LFFHADAIIPTGGDAGHYYAIAQNLAEYNSYSDLPISSAAAGINHAIPVSATATATWRPPLWPFVLSIWMQITSNPQTQMLLKLVFEGLLIGFVFLMLQTFDLGVVATGIFLCLLAVEPHYLKYSLTFLSENLTAFLLLVFSSSFMYSVMTNSRKTIWCCAIFGGLAVMSHPVVFPFVLMVFSIAIIRLFRSRRASLALVSSTVFAMVVLVWPLRNQFVFGQGLFMTTSQGAVFSKAWNEDVLIKHNNTQGDLLDEGLNVSRYNDLLLKFGTDPILNSQIMQQATYRFIGESDMFVLFKMALWKWYCGINPVPQTNKPGLIESAGTAFRVFYLLGLLLGIYSLVTNTFEPNSLPYWSAWVLILVFTAISITSIMLYTGIRFNSVYAPVNLAMTFLVILGFLKLSFEKKSTTVQVAT
jgi:hypothetical protein